MGGGDNGVVYQNTFIERSYGSPTLQTVFERGTLGHPSYMLLLQGDIGTLLLFTIVEMWTVGHPRYLLLLKDEQ